MSNRPISHHCGNSPHFSNPTHPHRYRDSCMAPRKRSAASADTTVVCCVRRRSIDTVLRCAAKPNTAPSTRRHHVLSNDLQGLVWDMDADTPLGRPLQNECGTRPCVAERTAAREFAAAKTTSNL